MDERTWIRGVMEGMAEDEEAWGEAQAAEGWLIVRGPVPDPWRERAIPLQLVPLLPRETEQVLAGDPSEPDVPAEDEPLLRLVARGAKISRIAHELGVSQRTIERRLARLRARLDAPSTTDLTALLARLGFGGPTPAGPASGTVPGPRLGD